ncbi:MAG: serine protease, partial [Synergistaceae bacterium]|nr:serine protease [Synergistaceae bacterium]
MKKRLLLLLIFLLALTIRADAHAALAAESPGGEFEERRGAVAEIMEAATVWVVIDNPEDYGFGSGFIVGDGYIVTNAHVTDQIARGGSIYVMNEKISPSRARVVGSIYEDESNTANVKDLALLRFDPPRGVELPVLSFNFDVKRMDRVSAWGYPAMATQFDISMELLHRGDMSRLEAPPVIYTEGAVNAIVRGKRGNSILHSASIAGGNSGGPLVNGRGEVVGINTWGYTEEDEGAFLNGAQLAADIARFLADNGVTPRLAAGQQMTARAGQEESASSRTFDRPRPDRNAVEVTWAGYSMTLPRGWSVAEEEEDTLIVG